MGLLSNAATGVLVSLRPEHVFGRNPARSDTHLSQSDVSMLHAVVRWRDGAWRLASYGRNQTLVDGQALTKGQESLLKHGQFLQFGASDDCRWLVRDCSAPGPVLIPEGSGVSPITLTNNQLLPNADAPELAIYRLATGSWRLERNGVNVALENGQLIQVEGTTYRFFVSSPIDDTAEPTGATSRAAALLSFGVSPDEERVRLRVRSPAAVADLGVRSHHYCLLTLARCRLRDAKSGRAPEEQGWLDCNELATMLRISATHLNIQVYRVRHQLLAAVPSAPQLASIVERRRGELRLGEVAFEIRRGEQLESSHHPHTEPLERAAVA